MLFGFGTVVVALSLQKTLGAPAMESHMDDIQCRCVTFRANERPTPCNFFESEGFSWRSAQSLAAQYDIKVQFASKITISRILSAHAPLPSDVLQTTSYGDAESTSGKVSASQNKIVCGIGKEVRHMTQHPLREPEEPMDHFVGQVVGWLMLFITVYMVGEYVWTRYSNRGRVIKLKGDEKPLQARVSNNSPRDTRSGFT